MNDEAESAAVIGRIRRFAFYAWIAFIIPSWWQDGWRGVVGLTCSAAVVMINFLWLEEIVRKVLQPTPHVSAWRLVVRTMARFALFGVALTVAIIVARFNVIGVLLGFSIVVVGIMGEAVYSGLRAGTDNFPADGAD
jgi:hypothetical protein